MRQIQACGELSINALADLAFTHQSTISEIVARLVQAGMVSKTRSSGDARKMKISLTERGTAALKNSPPTAQENLAKAITSLPKKDRKSLEELLRLVVDEAKLSAQKPGLFFEDS